MKLHFKDDKIVGYILLAVGVAMIFLSIYLMYTVFTGVSAPPAVFNLSDISLPGQEGSSIVLMSGEDLSRLASMGAWLTLMFFVLYAGGKIASLGISLVKEIKAVVKLKEPKQYSTPTQEEKPK